MINSEPSASSERTFNPLTVKIMIARIGQARQYLMKRWFPLLCAGATFALVCTAYFYFKSATYSAEISFALDEPSSEVTSAGFADLPGGLGLRQSPDPGGTVFSTLNNVTELIRSRLLIEKTLKSTVTVGDHQVVMADFFLDSLDYRTSWISERKYLHLKFNKDTTDESTNRMINALLGRMYDLLTAKIITVEKKGKGTSILGVKCTSTHELFSKYFIETLISNTEFYYTETRTQRAKINLVFIQGRTDSVRKVYNSAL